VHWGWGERHRDARVTLKVAGDGVAQLIGYYAGLARDQLHRDGTARGPVAYSLDPGEPPGGWWGSGRAAVGLDGEVLPEELQALLEGRHPATGDRLGRRFGDRSARGFDATFSATKSVSVLWALSPYPWPAFTVGRPGRGAGGLRGPAGRRRWRRSG
jgi:TrwC relaxase